MIKIKDLESILQSDYNKDVLNSASIIFKDALMNQNPSTEFVKDFSRMALHSQTLQVYQNEGLSVLMPVVNSKKKFDMNDISPIYIFYTGLLNREFVIGYDTTKGMVTSIYTKSEKLLEMLFKAGAFDNTEKYYKNMKALFGDAKQDFGNKVVSSLEKGSLAMGRLDVACVVGDEVSLDLTIPAKFRTDYGTTFKLYPYTVFPYLASSLVEFVNKMKQTTFSERNRKIQEIKALTILQTEEDGNVKTRKVTFNSEELVKAYRRGTYINVDQQEEAQNMLKNQIKKTTIKWDAIKLYLKGFNLEASLYSVPYSTIRFERILNITPCGLRDIDTSLYMIDFDSVRRLFRARVNNWHLNDFKEFNNIVDTDDCNNISERIQKIDSWSYNMEDSDIYKIMKMKRDLFEPIINGNKKTIEDGLDDMYRQKPRAAKNLKWVQLDSDFEGRREQVKSLLFNGVCKIESVSTRTGAPRVYYATNSLAVLKASYGENRLNAFESPKRAIKGVIALIQNGKVSSYNAFVSRLHKAEIDGLVEYSTIDENSTQQDWVNVCMDAYNRLEEKDKAKSMSSDSDDDTKIRYTVNFRRINADSANEFYGSVDVRNIQSIEFGEQKSNK